ncbi:MAG: undecaprenyl-diphosphate phosphatase [Cytophagales bacterium]|nr:undecaprenyl-diphosphate phosphatase [Cytophagales bacterium]
MSIDVQENLLFSVVLHAATALSTIVIFRKQIASVVKDTVQLQWNEGSQFAAKVFISMLPIGIVGLLFKPSVEMLFEGKTALVAVMLLCSGGLLLFAHYFSPQQGKDVSFAKAFVIGIAQAIAIIPGISRSGATLAAALILGVQREKATSFSFLMVLPPIFGAILLETRDYLENVSTLHISISALASGFVAAFLTGMFACRTMIHIVRNSQLIYFALYCFLIGTLSLIAWYYG